MAEAKAEMGKSGSVGTLALSVTILGYAALLSYTWPFGFAPVVEIQALPIVLTGFALVLLLVFLLLGILFCPIWLWRPNILRENLFKYSAPGTADNGSLDPEKLGIAEFLKAAYRGSSWFEASITLIAHLLFTGLGILAWYGIASQMTEPVLLILGIGPMAFAFILLQKLIAARTMQQAIGPIAGVTILFLVLPTIFVSSSTQPLGFGLGPNIFVRTALQFVGAGGEIPVEVNPISADSQGQGNTAGALIFFDGRRAWYAPCGAPDGEILQVDVSSLRLLRASKCSPISLPRDHIASHTKSPAGSAAAALSGSGAK